MISNMHILAYIIMLFASACYAQIQFAVAVGGTGSDYGWSIIHTSDGGYAVAGETRSFGVGPPELFLLKFDSLASMEWARAVGSMDWYGGRNDYGYSIIQTSDGGYIVIGATCGFTPCHLYCVKFNSFGAVEWSQSVGGANNDYGNSVVRTRDGGIIIVGYTTSFGVGIPDSSNVLVIKFGASGDIDWAKAIGGTAHDWGSAIVQTSDDGYALIGSSCSFSAGDHDIYLVKLASTGAVEWSRAIGGVYDDYGYSIVQTSDAGFAVAGWSEGFSSYDYGILVKLDSTGSIEWSRVIPGMRVYSIVQTNDDGLAIAGITHEFIPGIFDTINLFLAKFNSTGIIEWARAIGTDISEEKIVHSEGYSMIHTEDGGYAIAGWVESIFWPDTLGTGKDLFFTKFSPDGDNCMGVEFSPTVTVATLTVTNPLTTISNASISIASVSPSITYAVPTITIMCSTSSHEDTLCPDTLYCLFPCWNLIGGPVGGISADFFAEYPDILFPVFGWDCPGGYFIADTLEYKKGYWILALDTVVVCEDSAKYRK